MSKSILFNLYSVKQMPLSALFEVAQRAEEIKYLAGGQVVSSAKVGRRPAMVSTDPLSYAGSEAQGLWGATCRALDVIYKLLLCERSVKTE